jgi:hypothetical protein
VVEQQLQLKCCLVQVGGGQRLRALSQRGAGDGEGIDRIGLATGALPPARLAHQLRRHPDDPLAAGEEEALEGARDMAAVLDRPDALWVEVPPPVKQLGKARLAGARRQLTGQLAGSRKYRRAGVALLVGVRSDHDHLPRPFVWFAFERSAG